jgi:hypothetical protein
VITGSLALLAPVKISSLAQNSEEKIRSIAENSTFENSKSSSKKLPSKVP